MKFLMKRKTPSARQHSRLPRVLTRRESRRKRRKRRKRIRRCVSVLRSVLRVLSFDSLDFGLWSLLLGNLRVLLLLSFPSHDSEFTEQESVPEHIYYIKSYRGLL
jgi:hypothetical protein